MPNLFHEAPGDVLRGDVGRRLDDSVDIPRPYDYYARQIRPGEILYMGLSGGLSPKSLVVWIADESVYREYYGRYLSGKFRSIDFYALETTEIPVQDGSTIIRTEEPFGDYPDDAVPYGIVLEFIGMDDQTVSVRALRDLKVHFFPRTYLRPPWFEGRRL